MMRRNCLTFRAIALCLWLLGVVFATPALAQFDVHGLAVYEDRSGQATVSEIAALPDSAFTARPNGLSAGYTHSVHWLRFSTQVPAGYADEHSDAPLDAWWLEVQPPYLNDVRLYEPSSASPGGFMERRSGNQLTFAAREAPYRAFLFRLAGLDTQAKVYYVRVQTASTSLAFVRLWRTQPMVERAQTEYLMLGLLFGVLVAIALVNAIYWWSLREPIYRQYLVYLVAVAGMSFCTQGFVGQYLLPEQPQWVIGIQSALVILTASAAGRFYQSILQVEAGDRVLWVAYKVLTYLPLLMLGLVPLGYLTEALRTVISLTSVMVLVGLLRALTLMRRRVAGSRLVALATGLSILGYLINNFALLGFMSGNSGALYSVLVGSIGNIVALHFALAVRARAQDALKHQAQEQARRAEFKADREQRAREEQAHFISMIAHELKTPVAGIGAAVDALSILSQQEGDPPGQVRPEIATRLERIRRGTRRIDAIAARYLRMDRTDDTRLLPQLATHTMDAIEALVVSQFAGVSERLQWELNGSIQLRCDASLLATALINLIDNALKYSPEFEPIVVSVRDMDGRAVVIDVADRGAGIPDALRAAIFERYVRAPEHADVPGIGVGLTLTRKIIEAHAGQIEVLDREDGGTIFRITLPRAHELP